MVIVIVRKLNNIYYYNYVISIKDINMYQSIDDIGNKTEKEQSIEICLRNLLNTKKESLPFRRDFGIDLDEWLFQPYTFFVVKMIEIEIKKAVGLYCNEVIIKNIFHQFNEDLQTYYINIEYSIKNIDNIYNMELKLNKK